jgi:long-chain acyl-CoA synthetase
MERTRHVPAIIDIAVGFRWHSISAPRTEDFPAAKLISEEATIAVPITESIGEFFLAHFSRHSRQRAYGQRRGYRMHWFSYAEVLEMATRFADLLRTSGIKQGERVMLWSGVVVVPMDDAASADFAARVAQQVNARLWLCSRRHVAEINQSAGLQIPAVLLEDLSKIPGATDPARIDQASVTAGDILQIVFTSGTTAEPKGVIITHANVLANIVPLEREIKRYLKYERFVHPVRFLNLLPLSHVFGQFLAMFLPPLLGGTVIFQEELKPSQIVGTIRRERVSVLVAVPRVLQSLKQKIERDLEASGCLDGFRRRFRVSRNQHFLRRWWTFRGIHRQFGWKFWAFICGGAALDADTEEFWGRLGYAAIQGYGLTETTSLVSLNHPFKLGKGSIGKVLPGREVKLGEGGEILVRGPGVTSGYWGSSDSEISKNDGWYHTGDVGALDDAGNLYFKGRKKEVIVTPAGLNIHPQDLEAALRRQPYVKDCVVVGIERDGNSEPCAVVIMRGAANVKDAVDRANQSLADFQRMRMWLRWPGEDFPRTSTQKPRRSVIEEFATQHIFEQAGSQATRESSVAALIARITGRTASTAIDASAQLDSDLGLSSLDRVELIGALEDRYQIDLSETGLSALRTVGDIEKMLRGELPEVEILKTVEYHYPNWVLCWPLTWLRWLVHYSLMRPAMLLAWPNIEGRENLDGVSGPVLVVCNHISDVDFGFVQTSLPARLRHGLAIATRGEALEALHTPPADRNFIAAIYDRAKWFLGVSLLNLFPLPREDGFRESFAYAGRAVDSGYSVLVFPEGRHTMDGNINPFRAGIGLLAQNLNIPVLPMRIAGLFETKRSGKNFATPGAVKVQIGKPMAFPEQTAPEQIARELQSAVEAL